MSWALLLSEYPRSVLKGEEFVAILAYLERQGGATEDELIPFVKDRIALSGTILELHRNRLIDVSPTLVRLTARGKKLLDRFELRTDIVEDVLESLALSASEREVYRRSLVEYREHAFPLYLNSLRSMRTWELFDDKVLGHQKSRTLTPNEPDVDRETGKLTILLRSFRNWLVHYPESSQAWRDAQPDSAQHSDKARVLLQFKSLGRRSAAAYDCMERLDDASWAELPVPLLSSQLSRYRSLLSYFTYEQQMPATEWLDVCASVLRQPEANVSFLVLLNQNIRLRLAHETAPRSAERRLDLDRADFFDALPAHSDLLGALWAARDVAEFARLAGHDLDVARRFLESIRNQCDRVIEAFPAGAQEGQTSPEPESG